MTEADALDLRCIAYELLKHGAEIFSRDVAEEWARRQDIGMQLRTAICYAGQVLRAMEAEGEATSRLDVPERGMARRYYRRAWSDDS